MTLYIYLSEILLWLQCLEGAAEEQPRVRKMVTMVGVATIEEQLKFIESLLCIRCYFNMCMYSFNSNHNHTRSYYYYFYFKDEEVRMQKD